MNGSPSRHARRIHFSTWGRGLKNLRIADYAVRQSDEDFLSDLDIVVRSIERTNPGLTVCAGPRSEGTALTRGEPTDRHYAITLGRPVPAGGYSPEAEVWISIPVIPPLSPSSLDTLSTRD